MNTPQRFRLIRITCLAALAMAATATAEPGYYKLKTVRIMDNQGFGQPVEAARFLLPADWRTEGGIQWDGSQTRCPGNIIQFHFRAVAPDGVTGIEITPSYVWQNASDPMMQQVIRQQAAAGTGCDSGAVVGAAAYLRQTVLPHLRPGARVTGIEPLPAVTQAKQTQLAQSYEQMVRAGYLRGYRADSASIHVEYARNGQAVEEWLSTSVFTLAMPSADTSALMQGQMNMSASTFTMVADGVFAARAPAGRLDKKLIATIVASIRPNPQYQAAITQFLTNMGNIATRGAMDRSRIWTEAGRQISATITESYRQQQAVQDRAAQQFSQTIRGVETYVNPATGSRVELTSGYENAWVNTRGEYLLSDQPGFNPAVELKEDWNELTKSR